MLLLTIGQAAKSVGRSKSTVWRDVKNGRISATRNAITGSFEIDPAELIRVYPPVSSATADDTPRNGLERDGVTAALIEELRATIADLRARLDASETERRTTLQRLTALLEPPQRQRWRRWFR